MHAIASAHVSRNYWGLRGLRGLLAVVFGVIAIVWPHVTLLVLVLLFGAYVLVDGVVAVIVSLQERKNFRQWWVLLLGGLAGIVVGVLTFGWPGLTALVLLYLISVAPIL